jgi:hypothetical protein
VNSGVLQGQQFPLRRKNVIVQFQKFALENISQTGCQKKFPHKNKANRKKKIEK